eukprot:TRINITY_DN2103_c0_g1_i1.p1 TRINITY_DN2103_c0_g1~~TRINITY_DN2103_c0_g1_i1.p1  ORF type:complete len:674 (+),score=121.48 TRINITY_DN2103_c0_g1_i1:97-2118(+)
MKVLKFLKLSLLGAIILCIATACITYSLRPDQELPVWYYLNLCPIYSTTPNLLEYWIGYQLDPGKACPVTVSEGTELTFNVPSKFFTPDAPYNPIIFRKNNLPLNISFSVFLGSDLKLNISHLQLHVHPLSTTPPVPVVQPQVQGIDVPQEQQIPHASLSDLLQPPTEATPVKAEEYPVNIPEESLLEGDGLGKPVPQTPKEVDSPSPYSGWSDYGEPPSWSTEEEKYGQRTILKGSGSTSQTIYRSRYGNKARYPTVSPIQVAYGLSGLDAVITHTNIRAFHNGPPLPGGAVDCHLEDGCYYELRHAMTRDELSSHFLELSQEQIETNRYVRLVVHDVVAVSPATLPSEPSVFNFFWTSQPTVVRDPEVFLTFATQKESTEMTHIIVWCVFLTVILFILLIIVVVVDFCYNMSSSFDDPRDKKSFPFPPPPEIDIPYWKSFSSTNGDYKSLSSVLESVDIQKVLLPSNDITSVSGMNFAPKLKVLNLYNNDLKTLEGFAPCSLVVLDLSSNDLKNVKELPKIDTLVWLCLANNDIISISDIGERFPLLTHLDVSDNDITSFSLDLKSDHPLEWLDASSNEIETLSDDFLHAKSLLYFDLSNNNLKSVAPVHSSTQLLYLNLRKNRLCDTTEIEAFKEFPSLRYLFIRRNKFRSAQLDELVKFFGPNSALSLN